MADITRTMTARRSSTCPACTEPIEPGDKIARKERKGGGWAGAWKHARCEVTWLVDGRTIEGSGGVALRVAINAEGEHVGDNRQSILGAIAEHAPRRDPRGRAAAERAAAALDRPECSGSWQAYGTEGKWGVRIVGNGNRPAEGHAGQVCRVTSRSGKGKNVRLGAIAERRTYCTIYAIAE